MQQPRPRVQRLLADVLAKLRATLPPTTLGSVFCLFRGGRSVGREMEMELERRKNLNLKPTPNRTNTHMHSPAAQQYSSGCHKLSLALPHLPAHT
ncbi:GL13043 [Drosophila persimilis]|uniref:GL13043 n=1 Tax=Drosophila persimilis TaxID=7234 RepID=B4GUV8_DROPE|nr:GL13043 [Drosophila persimilis]